MTKHEDEETEDKTELDVIWENFYSQELRIKRLEAALEALTKGRKR